MNRTHVQKGNVLIKLVVGATTAAAPAAKIVYMCAVQNQVDAGENCFLGSMQLAAGCDCVLHNDNDAEKVVQPYDRSAKPPTFMPPPPPHRPKILCVVCVGARHPPCLGWFSVYEELFIHKHTLNNGRLAATYLTDAQLWCGMAPASYCLPIAAAAAVTGTCGMA